MAGLSVAVGWPKVNYLAAIDTKRTTLPAITFTFLVTQNRRQVLS